jgi:hypothetical protein
MQLERVGRIAADQARGEHGLGVGARAAGHRGVDDFHARVRGTIDFEHGVQPVGFAAGRPPREDFKFLLRRRGLSGGGGLGGSRGRGRGCTAAGGQQQCADRQQTQQANDPIF